MRRISIICNGCKELVDVQDRQIAEHSHNGVRCDRSGDRYISVRSGGSVSTTGCESGCDIGIGPVFTHQGQRVGTIAVSKELGTGLVMLKKSALVGVGSGNGSGSVN